MAALRSSPLQSMLRRNAGIHVGDAIVAVHPEHGQWYSGHVLADNGDGTFAIQYDDGEFEPRCSSVKHLGQASDNTQVRLLRAIQENNVTLAEQCLSRKGRPIDLLQCVDGQGTPTIVWALAVADNRITSVFFPLPQRAFWHGSWPFM